MSIVSVASAAPSPVYFQDGKEKVMTSSWKADQRKILSRGEVEGILQDLRRKVARSVNTRLNKVVFILATCCGLMAPTYGTRLGAFFESHLDTESKAMAWKPAEKPSGRRKRARST